MHVRPEVGEWYLDLTSNQQFEVVAIDIDSDAIEIQYFDGNIDELDFEAWFDMEISAAPAPEDWSGPYELDDEEMDETEESMQPDIEENPFDQLDA